MQNPFEGFFSDPVYLEYKNHLFNYLARVRALRAVTRDYRGRSLEIGSGISPVTEASVYTDLEPAAMGQLRTILSHDRHAFLSTDATKLAFQPESFDSVILSEVLEHISDDRKVLAEIARVLKRGGRTVITVPIHSYYWAFDDEYVSHQRRYSVPELAEKVESAGFEIIRKKKIAGPVARLGTWLSVRLFLLFWRSSSSEGPRNDAQYLRLFFPAYKLINQLLAAWILFDAWCVPECLASVLLLECRKK